MRTTLRFWRHCLHFCSLRQADAQKQNGVPSALRSWLFRKAGTARCIVGWHREFAPFIFLALALYVWRRGGCDFIANSAQSGYICFSFGFTASFIWLIKIIGEFPSKLNHPAFCKTVSTSGKKRCQNMVKKQPEFVPFSSKTLYPLWIPTCRAQELDKWILRRERF